jgi:outer membrane protein TolC
MRRDIGICLFITAVFLLILPAFPVYCGQLAPYRLTLEEAIKRGLQANVGVLVAGTRVTEAAGTRERRLSGYLPHAYIETPAAYQTVNIKAQGISFPGAPSVVGPFASYDFRVYVDQTLIDFQNYHTIKASEKGLQAARNDYQDTRNLVIRLIARLYLNAESSAAEVDAAESRVKTSETLEKLARDEHDAGVATGLDVLRAQVELANDRQSLLFKKNSLKQALMTLARNIGLDPGIPLELADALKYEAIETPQIEEAVSTALADREDYRSLLSQRGSLEEQLKASKCRYLPRVALSGNYGGNGQRLNEIEPTYLIRANLIFTIFDLDREGERIEIGSLLKRTEQQIADERLGIEQDVREAVLNLESAADEVAVADAGMKLAVRELQLATDRFKNGVANNIEVVNAQDALARAQENSIVAITRHADAKIALARAMGDTEKIYKFFLGIK